MDSTSFTLTSDEFKIFHGIDRSLYLLLVTTLHRNPLESLYVMGLWMWVERSGFTGFISQILSLPHFLTYEIAEEAVLCLKYLNPDFPFSTELSEIPLTCKLLESDLSLQYFHHNRPTVFKEIKNLVSRVLLPTVSDIMEKYRSPAPAPAPARVPSPALPASYMSLMRRRSSIKSSAHGFFPSMNNVSSRNIIPSLPSPARAAREASRTDRTMFVTFSKGYPVTKDEVTTFFTRVFGNCIESLHMQEVEPHEQSLYARIVFVRAYFIDAILDGQMKAKFSINGKHVWLRKFVPRNNRALACGCPSFDACTCILG